jgi:hypothetical protein
MLRLGREGRASRAVRPAAMTSQSPRQGRGGPLTDEQRDLPGLISHVHPGAPPTLPRQWLYWQIPARHVHRRPEPEPHSRRVLLKIGDVVVATGKRAIPAGGCACRADGRTSGACSAGVDHGAPATLSAFSAISGSRPTRRIAQAAASPAGPRRPPQPVRPRSERGRERHSPSTTASTRAGSMPALLTSTRISLQGGLPAGILASAPGRRTRHPDLRAPCLHRHTAGRVRRFVPLSARGVHGLDGCCPPGR